jgi:hypothetical protein
LAFIAVLLLSACPKPTPPGDQAMGQYTLTATSTEREACELEEMVRDGGGYDFTFDALLTRESTSDRAWVTLNDYSREGTFDGQVFVSEASASRVFVLCECSTRLVETLSVALLSRSQSDALSGQCPANPLDGGVPAPDPDAGILAPGPRETSFDSVLLCGELVTRVVADALPDGGACDARCTGCTARYQLRGDRR